VLLLEQEIYRAVAESPSPLVKVPPPLAALYQLFQAMDVPHQAGHSVFEQAMPELQELVAQ
jgi:hypothetical protein